MQRRPVDLLWLGLLGSIWGASYLFIKVALGSVPALTLVAARLALGAAVMWILMLVTRQPVPRKASTWATFAVMGLLNGAVPYSLITWGELHISSGLASMLQATTPIFTVILAHFLGDERMTAAKLAGVAVGFIGVGILMVPDLSIGTGGSPGRQGIQANLLGQLAVVASSLSYAAAALVARSRLRGQPALVSTTGQLTMGAAMMVPLSLAVDRPFHLEPSAPAVASWLGLTLLGTVVAYMIYYRLIERTGATFTSMVTYIIPVNGLILGALVLDEPLTAGLIAGLALILLGVLLVRR